MIQCKHWVSPESTTFAVVSIVSRQDYHVTYNPYTNERVWTFSCILWNCLQEMTWRLDKKTFRWKYVEALEPPRVVHVRTTEMMSKDNKYAQVTVRLHTKQVCGTFLPRGLRLCKGRICMSVKILKKSWNLKKSWSIPYNIQFEHLVY